MEWIAGFGLVLLGGIVFSSFAYSRGRRAIGQTGFWSTWRAGQFTRLPLRQQELAAYALVSFAGFSTIELGVQLLLSRHWRWPQAHLADAIVAALTVTLFLTYANWLSCREHHR